MSGLQNYGLHVNFVEVRSYLTVHFDTNEFLIEYICRFGIFKGLVAHHMAPMTGSIANTEKNGLILVARSLNGLIPPWVPVNGIVLVLLKVR